MPERDNTQDRLSALRFQRFHLPRSPCVPISGTYRGRRMNTRFAVATHILTFLECQDGVAASSELIASSVNTNPTLIRRLLSQLSKAALTTSQMGTGGGALLARPASAITLLDVHKAINDDIIIFPLHQGPNPKCPVGRNIAGILRGRTAGVEQAMETELLRTTIADLARDISAVNSAS